MTTEATMENANVPVAAWRTLNARELDVLRLIALGASYDQIALDMDTTVNTIKSRMKRIFRKLDARNSPHAVNRAIGLGVIESIGDDNG